MTDQAAPAPLREEEREAAVALWEEAGLTRPWNDPLRDIALALGGPSSTILAIRDDAGLAGTVMVGHDGHRGWLYYLAVAERARGRGLGTALVRAAEAWLAARGVPAVQLMVRDGNAAAGFYLSLGYTPRDVTVLGRRLDA